MLLMLQQLVHHSIAVKLTKLKSELHIVKLVETEDLQLYHTNFKEQPHMDHHSLMLLVVQATTHWQQLILLLD